MYSSASTHRTSTRAWLAARAGIKTVPRQSVGLGLASEAGTKIRDACDLMLTLFARGQVHDGTRYLFASSVIPG